MLLEEYGVIDEYLFVHPKDVQDGIVEVTRDDVLANVPYVPGCGLWFDHHSSEEERLDMNLQFKFTGASRPAASCARVIYDYYGGAEHFNRFDETGLMAAVDKSDSGQFTRDEILNPTGWVLLSFIMDSRTGLGRYRDYRVSNLDLMRNMIKYCRTMTVGEILEIPDVKERVVRYFEQQDMYKEMMAKRGRVEGNVLLIDLREIDELPSGNRFIEYALFPEQNVSIRAIWGRGRRNIVITAGHSILNRTCRSDIGSLMLKYEGGGHRTVGTCQVPAGEADRVLKEVLEALKVEEG